MICVVIISKELFTSLKLMSFLNWSIIHILLSQPLKLLRDLGITRASELQYCDASDLQQLAACLKKIPAKRILRLSSFTPQVISGADLEESWDDLHDTVKQESSGLDQVIKVIFK